MATLRVYVATQWNTVLTVHNVTERPAPRASGREVDYWADVTVDNNGGTPHRCEVSLREAFARVLDPEPAMSTPRFQADDSPRYVTDEQLVEHFRAAITPVTDAQRIAYTLKRLTRWVDNYEVNAKTYRAQNRHGAALEMTQRANDVRDVIKMLDGTDDAYIRALAERDDN